MVMMMIKINMILIAKTTMVPMSLKLKGYLKKLGISDRKRVLQKPPSPYPGFVHILRKVFEV